MDAERPGTVDDLVASVKPTAPPPEDPAEDDAEPAELEPIDSRQLLIFAGPPLILAAGFGLWLIAWWVPLLVLALGALAFLAWHGKIPGLKGASRGLSGGGKTGWQLGRPRGSSGLLGGSTGRSGSGGKGGLASALGLGGRKKDTTSSPGKPTLRERARNAASKARDTARKAATKAGDKARHAVHKATGGRYGKPRATSSTGGNGSAPSTGSGKGSTLGGSTSSSGGGKDTSDGKRKRRNPITALTDLVKGRTTHPDKDGDKPEKARSKHKKKKTKAHDDPAKDESDEPGADTPDGIGPAAPAHTGDGDEDKGGLLGAYGRLANKVGDKIRAIDPKALKAAAKDALGTPFKGLFTRKPKAEDPTGKPSEDTPPAPDPTEDKPAPDKTRKPPTTWDDSPPPPTEDKPSPPSRYLDDDMPELPKVDDLPRPRREPTYDDNPPPVRHAAYREPRPTPTYDDWIDPDPEPSSGTRAHTPAPAPTEKARRSTTMTVTATGAPVTSSSDERSTPDTRAERWERMAEGEEADARVFSLKADEFQETIDVLKARENQTLATEEQMREAQEGKAEAEAQAHARMVSAQRLREQAQAERAQKTS